MQEARLKSTACLLEAHGLPLCQVITPCLPAAPGSGLLHFQVFFTSIDHPSPLNTVVLCDSPPYVVTNSISMDGS